ncbi:16S rRNA (uracil(1498)-N(3))-methyltransferase [Catenovulum sp. SM1970]|uniref:16S rRNA (uracil(1498)-N(3))-methyltransferase n=1 Tax=Marinifaba aquimaris TaxID=2741323 RepID=UPI001572629E|nr:16S rRNA (uracil(1498)-N(3))-methyltransferase [Marinifaba aquimaris]NTS78600.1 16S rRNA (uracil(1498)-N(3))-methyltransferase [Marinifaba aquimaris]
MRIPRIYHSHPLSLAQSIELEPDAANHVGRVLRLQINDEIRLFNGDGFDYYAELIDVSKKKVLAEVIRSEQRNNESPLQFHLGQVISRGDRMDFTLQKSVELGVTEITPLFSERCGVKLNAERLNKKIEQWQKIVISACEQSGRAFVPKINPAQYLQEWFSQDFEGTRLNLHPLAEQSMQDVKIKQQAVQLLIGPEGGLTDEEINQSHDYGFEDVLMGPRVLRTETAALAAISMLQCLHGDI